MSDPGFAVSVEERRRLLEANVAASQFFRRELLRATGGWPLRYLTDQGAREVLSTESIWKIGYAPDSWTRLVDHLREQGFSYGTLVRAGLVEWTDEGEAVDRYRDQLMLVARDQRSAPVGFIGIGPDGQARSVTPTTAIHRPSNVLVGVDEQRVLLGDGAVPIIVDDPMDAIAISKVSRQARGRWAGIPVCGAGLSTAQARILSGASVTDTAVVVLSGGDAERRQTAGYLLDLAFFFDRVRVIGLPPGQTPASLYLTKNGPQQLREALETSRPLADYRSRRYVAVTRRLRTPDADPDPPARGPGL
ncbi:DNA primase-like protein [Kribbella antiqua]|uniref:DNA primase-like protein n=1 Tax=Kribbella antiqua TaxID=2512217 RepID=A0A4R2IA45_9ACTN|nr:hypothetical protein [Kribbella antiqua]TCO41017.1 DNA primase-like protein [Kribbella antiqua]